MISTPRPANLSYGTDSVAQSLRSVLAAAPAVRVAPHASSGPRKGRVIDMPSLYPTLFVRNARAPFLTRTARALAFRLTVFGTTAAVMVFLQHSF